MLDVDHFKDVNDHLGHLGGGAVLRDLARLLREGVREVDAVGRYGGEEFVLLLPETGYDEAVLTAERLRQRVEHHAFPAGERAIRVTVSLGVASFPAGPADSAATLIREADRALYRAKQEGRNRTR
jgi:diguanylate cyclase (GGDEF)-like protein